MHNGRWISARIMLLVLKKANNDIIVLWCKQSILREQMAKVPREKATTRLVYIQKESWVHKADCMFPFLLQISILLGSYLQYYT